MKEKILKLYGDQADRQIKRFTCLAEKYEEKFENKNIKFFSSPGRTEIGGNHTDHNHGKVVAASINLDSIAAAAPRNDSKVVLYSEDFDTQFEVGLNSLEPAENEKSSTAALVRGVAAELKQRGYNIGGFNAYVTSEVLIGSGLSSSASIEVLIGTIFNHFYNTGKVPSEQIAIIGQYAENKFFGKPCGLMDQVACATGGIITIDFYDPQKPVIKKIDFDFNTTGYKLVVVDTEENHADLTEDYASIPAEMKQVANYFNKEYCAEITLDQLLADIKGLRKKVNDRAILRAIHFLEENRRVDDQVLALANRSFGEFLKLINESGNSSYKYLQNIYSPKNYKEQGVSLGLALSELFIKEKGRGACRVHGGGFAGTIQLFLPDELIEEYNTYITKLFKEESVKVLSIRNYGAVCLDEI